MTLASNPIISVVMPVYNADDFLEDSINSILHQTFHNFEFIIVCSDPSDRTQKILEKFKRLDDRILVFYQKRNGIIFARNFGCNLAKGKYIAVMDADDLSNFRRFEIQLSFMEQNPDIGIVGSWAYHINERGDITGSIHSPIDPLVIGWHLFFKNCIMHSSILIRTDILKMLNFYSLGTNGFPEDYDLWTRAFFVTKIAIIPKPLDKYRKHMTNNSINVKFEIEKFDNTIKNIMLKKFLGDDFQAFFCKMNLQMTSSIFTFDFRNNNDQAKFLEHFYYIYKTRYSLTPSQLDGIRSHISITLLSYSFSMFRFSISSSIKLFVKSIHYMNINTINELIYIFASKCDRIISNYHRKL
jgi:glycosyltransferase involved in cell wall biosynthesis